MPEHAIIRFSGYHRWLSNFWCVPVQLDGIWYTTVEHAYQAAKTLDVNLRAKIAVCVRPGEAKRLGRRVPLRPDWEEIKLEVMEKLLRQKFAASTTLARQLTATGDAELIEGNPWGDRFWGVCDGEGKNHLGRLLMAVRKDLQNG